VEREDVETVSSCRFGLDGDESSSSVGTGAKLGGDSSGEDKGFRGEK
jgi:hypothetical protein